MIKCDKIMKVRKTKKRKPRSVNVGIISSEGVWMGGCVNSVVGNTERHTAMTKLKTRSQRSEEGCGLHLRSTAWLFCDFWPG